MAAPLLTTKLYIPPPRPREHVVSRPRLIERLDEGLRPDQRLTLISAPAGYGKTTLLGEWISCRGNVSTTRSGIPAQTPPLHVAWISLDEGDNDPTRFLTYLVGALQTVDTEIGQDTAAALRALQHQQPSTEMLLTGLINEITNLSAPLVLVLDDYHVIKAQPVHQAISFLIDHVPAHVHLIIATRTDPPLHLARLRARMQLSELRAAELRFTTDEAAAFLNQVTGLDLSSDDVAALESRTEGWIVGLQLAALSMKDREDIPGFIAAFTGSHHYILDYLTEEVLRRQPENVQTFLLHTTVLDRLCGPLCDALLDIRDRRDAPSHEILEHLESCNLFIVPLDDERRWYRYHRLFADLLLNRLGRLHADQVPELHRRASLWYEHNGSIAEAVRHAVSAGDWPRAADLVEQRGWQLLGQGEIVTISRWLTALPEDLVRARTELCILYAWILVLTGQSDAVESRLQDAEKNLALQSASAESEDALGHIAAVRAYAATHEGDATRAIVLAREALERLPGDDLAVRSIISFTLGSAYLLTGDVAGACQAFAEASEIGRASGDVHVAVSALSALGGQQMALGRLYQASETFQTVLHLSAERERDGKPLPITARAYSGLSELHYEWNDLEAATRYAKESVELAKRWGNAEVWVRTPLALAWALQARGDMDGAYAALEKADQFARRHHMSLWSVARVEACRVRLWLAPVGGDMAAAARWAEARESVLQADGELPYGREREYLALARVLIALGRYGDALDWLARLRAAASAGDRVGRVIETLVLEAVARQARGERQQAISTLEQALSLARPEGYVRTFLDEGAPVAALLSEMAGDRQSPNAPYVRRLLAAFGIEVDGRGRTVRTSAVSTAVPSPHPLVEPLTERELEVLGCIAAGLSNAEIAGQLFIAVSTVKRHINHIFGKLGVTSRVQAVVRAQELGLL
jgi:LuxR family maltose regulon positive regulatory protein